MGYSIAEMRALGDVDIAGPITTASSQYRQILEDITAIDPAAPDATAQLDSLQAQRIAIKQSLITTSQYLAFSDAVDNPGLFTTKAEVSAYLAEYNVQVAAALGVTGPDLDAAIVAQRAAITAATKEAAAATPPASTDPAGTSASGAPAASPNSLTGAADDTNEPAGATAAGVAQGPGAQPTATAKKTGATTQAPDRRRSNPLSMLTSYTYQITLYMITPDALNAFVLGGRKNINTVPGAYIVAQSGGAPVTGTGPSFTPRAPGFELDYYIDDLKITTVISGKPGAINTEMTFTVTEPYGFSFISHLQFASDEIKKTSKLRNFTSLQNATRQFFIMSIKFNGYGLDGKPVTSADINTQESLNTASGKIFEHFYDVSITTMDFKLSGNSVVYSIKAATMTPLTAFGLKHGHIDNGARVIARTVEEAIGGGSRPLNGAAQTSTNVPGRVEGLLTTINEHLSSLAAVGQDSATPDVSDAVSRKNRVYPIASEYYVEWQGDDADVKALKTASIVSPSDTDKRTYAMSRASTSEVSNAATEVATNPITTSRTLTFSKATSILKAIELIIKQSSYVEDALKVLQQNQIDRDSGIVEPGGTRTLKWYNISARVEVKDWDQSVNDFAYIITYIIRPYEIPSIATPLAAARTKYYGPHKKYEYWFTGKNSEMLSFEQTFNNAFFNTMFKTDATKDGGDVANKGNSMTDASTQGKVALSGNAAQNTIVTQLDDPAAYTAARIKILGDPDFLIQDSPASISELYGAFYGADGYTINATGGQVFIEVVFKEAVDYENSTGLLKVNNTVQFWPYPPEVQKILEGGVSYQVIGVKHLFSKGVFTQELETTINSFPNYKSDAQISAAAAAAETSKNNTAATAARTGVNLTAEAGASARAAFAAVDPRRTDLVRPIIDSTGTFTNATNAGVATSTAPPIYSANDDKTASGLTPAVAAAAAGREVPTLPSMMVSVRAKIDPNTLLPIKP